MNKWKQKLIEFKIKFPERLGRILISLVGPVPPVVLVTLVPRPGFGLDTRFTSTTSTPSTASPTGNLPSSRRKIQKKIFFQSYSELSRKRRDCLVVDPAALPLKKYE